MAKAIKITSDNRSTLSMEYGIELDDLVVFEGNYLVTGFGGHPVNGIVSAWNIKKLFHVTEINNEEQTYSIEKKERIGA